MIESILHDPPWESRSLLDVVVVAADDEIDTSTSSMVDMITTVRREDGNDHANPKRGTTALFWMFLTAFIIVITTLVSGMGVYCFEMTWSCGDGWGNDVGGTVISTSVGLKMSDAPMMPPTTVIIIMPSPVQVTTTTTITTTTRPIQEQLSVACHFLSITNLTECQTRTFIDTSYNAVGNTIPTEIGLLTQLTRLDLCDNDLVGTIPSILGNLIRLTSLDLYGGQLTGTIPSTLGNLIHLNYLGLDHHQLTGTIPSTILRNLTQLTTLSLYANRLTGTIPSTLGNLVQLTALYLSENQLNGTIPSTLRNLTQLNRLFLDENQLNGPIPSTLCSNSNINIYIDCTKLTCTCCQGWSPSYGSTGACPRT
jgi:hypothetical protein